MLTGRIDRSDEAIPGSPNFVERDAADLTRQANGATGLVVDPSQRQFVGPHIGSWVGCIP
jgi:hypothetical protein